MFKLVAITAPVSFAWEFSALEKLAREDGISGIHLRKPGWSERETRMFLERLPLSVIRKIRLHDHHWLQKDFSVQGIHLNARHPSVPADHIGPVSASCHNFMEIRKQERTCDYVFLSPVFDSLSKKGYRSAFLPQTLENARKEGILSARVLALGGIAPSNMETVREMGFGGAAVLGSLWGNPEQEENSSLFEQRLQKLIRHACQN